ncbi:MAG TPA: hypothetical protein VGC10_01190 [Sphingomonas sp.]
MRRVSLSLAMRCAVAAMMAAVPVVAEAQYQDDGYRGRPVGYDRGVDPRGDGGRDRDGRRYRCRDDGSGGAIIGAIAGGLLGNAAAGYGDRAAGTIMGGVGGALAGRAIDRGC